ncbi:MAG TPA: hypothetical protein VGG74_17845 [Kofleriaceae bacterium]|jgi:hypothetical protein
MMAVASLGAGRRAHADPPNYAAARNAWSACFPAGSAVPAFPTVDPDDPGSSVTVTRTSGRFRIEKGWGGSGHEASYWGITIELDPKTCAALWDRDFSYDGAFLMLVRIGWTKRAAPDERDLADFLAPPAHDDDPRFAMARAWLDHSCDGGWFNSTISWEPGHALSDPIAPAQPWHQGEPVKSQRSFWSQDQLRAIGARASLHIADDDEQLAHIGPGPEQDGVVVPGIAAPTKTFAVGPIEIREATVPGRSVGRAIALYDRANSRHRWVLLTRGCVQGTAVKWLGAIGARAIGITSSDGHYEQHDAIVVIDTAAGTAWAVRLPDAVVSGDIAPANATLARATITFGKGSAATALDLTQALGELPKSP